MPNMLDYIHWRGDLPFSQDPVNMVDNLIFSQLAYADLRGLVPSGNGDESVPLSRACDGYLRENRDQSDMINDPKPALIAAAASARFRDVALRGFADVVDGAKEEQFSAVTFVPPGDGPVYVAFRGTDSSIAGWREDFNFSFMAETPAQLAAAEYLTAAARLTNRPLIVGGHSKGGNLAVYAAAFAGEEAREKVMLVCSNDGPGFNSKVADSEAYRAIIPKVRLFMPESSLVGLLMANRGKRMIVKSSARGLQQHNPYTWEVMGPAFVNAGEMSAVSLFMDDAMRLWLDDLTDEEKKAFTAAVFQALEENGLFTSISLKITPSLSARALAAGFRMLTGERQRQVLPVLQKLVGAWGAVLKEGALQRLGDGVPSPLASLRELIASMTASAQTPGRDGEAPQKA